MDSKYFQKCIFIFHLLGQNSYDLRVNKGFAWLQHIPRIIYLLLTIGMIVRHCVIEGYRDRPEASVFYLILALAFAINVAVFLEYFVVTNGVQKLQFAYEAAIDYLKRKIHVELDYELFNRSFQCHVKIVFWTFLTTLTIQIIFILSGNAKLTEFMIILFYYLKHFAAMHVLFHVEFVHFLMQTVIREIVSLKNRQEFMIDTMQTKPIKLLQTLRHLKCVHFRLWKIIEILNNRFGWILIALMLATILDVTNSSYWMWVFVRNGCHEQINRFIRNYFWCFVFVNCCTLFHTQKLDLTFCVNGFLRKQVTRIIERTN